MNIHAHPVERDRQDELKKLSFDIVRRFPTLATLMANPDFPPRNEFLVERKPRSVAQVRHGSRVRVRSNGETGRVTFVDGDEITVVIDGYEGSNTFKRSNLEEIPK